MAPQEEHKDDASERKKSKKKKKEQAKLRMEIIRTICAVGALIINCAVLSHVLGLW